MNGGFGTAVSQATGCRWVMRVGALALVATLAGCGGGGGGSGQPPASGGGPVPNPPVSGGCTAASGTGNLRVKVTDAFGEAVPGATMEWIRPGNGTVARAVTDASGVAQVANLPACVGRVSARHVIRGATSGLAKMVTIQRDRTLDVSLQLKPYRQPVAAVLSTAVDPGGVSADGKSLDFTLRIAVTGGGLGFVDVGGAYGIEVPACVARTGAELAELGPRCISGGDGRDQPYSFGGLIGLGGGPRRIQGEPQAWSVGVLVDQSEAGISPYFSPNEPRLFAAKTFAHAMLPDAPLALAAFASDMASGSASSLPQRPVTFFPVEAPVFATSPTEAFRILQDFPSLVGGGAPLYEAIVAGLDFMAARAPAGRKRVLVVLADGADTDCGTRAHCAELRRRIVDRARSEEIYLFLVGDDSGDDCVDPRAQDCLEIRAKEELRLLATEGGVPLVVSHEPAFDWDGALVSASAPVGPLDLVGQWLSGSMKIQEISVRLTSDAAGAFMPGAVVTGELAAMDMELCPSACWQFMLPFRVEVPE